MPSPIQVTVYRGDEAMRLVVPNRALTQTPPSRARTKWIGAGCTPLAKLLLAGFLTAVLTGDVIELKSILP